MNIKERLITLETLNANPAFVNKQLYRLLYNEELYVIAYDNLRGNKGAMTAGISRYHGTADGLSMDKIRQIIASLKNKSYQPKPARRVYIPKANGKSRPLGMPDFKDKLVQECVRIILECIYDSSVKPSFLATSFGFRKGLGCHHALKKAFETFEGTAWIIKADIKSFFDEVDHHVLISLLKKRIDDQKFIHLIWKLLRCGYVEKGQLHKAKKGTPQGGNVSPILANIYLHEFDLFIEKLKKELSTTMRIATSYRRISSRLTRAKQKLRQVNRLDDTYKDKMAKVNTLSKQLLSMPSMVTKEADKAVFAYVRYADDWILGLKCTKGVAKEIYNRCEQFFKTRLKLEWNQEKSMLSRSTDRDFEFLGVDMHFVNQKQVRIRTIKTPYGRLMKRRTVKVNTMHYVMNAERIFSRLRKKGFVNNRNEPISHKKIINQDIIDIVKTFKYTMTGIGNYYRFVHNPEQLNYIHFVLFMSLCKTLAHKGKTRKRQIMKKYGGRILTFKYGKDRKKEITIPKYGGDKRDLHAFNIKGVVEDTNPIRRWFYSNTAIWLRIGICGLCGKRGNTEMHHVKHIRRQGQSYKGFDLALRAINRKQVPLCLACHKKVHFGLYNGINIKEAAKQFYRHLGFNKWQDREKYLANSIDK